MKKALVTGSEGYIGSVLVPILINKGYNVVGLDICYYSDGNLNNFKFPKYKIINKDLRDVELDDFKGSNYYAIIHLAALSNDPLGMLDEKLTFDINFKASVRLAELAKKAGVKRFIYSSSCSLYGKGNKLKLTEKSQPNPQTAYGKSKIMAEKEISKLADEKFSPIFMRNATAFGFSPRMRFDLVVNSLCGFAKTENEIKILGDGKPWRPLVHIRDIAGAMIKSLEVDRKIIHNQVFNVGDNKENYQIRQIAEEVKNEFYTKCNISIAKKDTGDTRNYNVSFDKLKNTLGFSTNWSLKDGIVELGEEYKKVSLNKNIFENRLYTRLKQIKHLLKEGVIDKSLRRINNG